MPGSGPFEGPPDQVVETEVVVIGGGIVGLATAYFLAKHGKQVAVLERRALGYEASGRTAAGVRQQGRDAREIHLARASVALWSTLTDELGSETHYRQSGNLFVATTEEELASFAAIAEREQSLGLDVELLRHSELKKMVPELSNRCIGGKYCSTDGVAEPSPVISAFANAIQREGGRLYPFTEALDFVVEEGRVASVLTRAYQFRTRVTVNAAGPWAALLAMRVGVTLPITPARAQLIETEHVGPLFKEFLVFPSSAVYCRTTITGHIHFGPMTVLTSSDIGRLSARAPSTASVQRKIGSLIPALENVPIRQAWAGLSDVTPDALPIIGPVSGLRDYIVAAGFSGHGFALGPAVGSLLAESIVERKTAPILETFSPSRFSPP